MAKKGHKGYLGANVLALRDAGKTEAEIADALTVSQQTVSDILTGKGKWAAIARETWFDSYRVEMKRKHEAIAHELSTEALKRLQKTLPYTSASQAAVVFGILQDKARLLAGESTKNISVAVHIEADALSNTLTKLVNALREEVTPHESTPIDVTPVEGGGPS